QSRSRDSAYIAHICRPLPYTTLFRSLFTDLVDEDDTALAAGDGARELTQGLTHQAGLEAHMGVTHFAFDFSTGDQGGDRVDHDQDRKSTRLNSSHVKISYAVFCSQKK